MPSFDVFKKMNSNAHFDGHVRKNQSDMIMEATWYEDIATRTAWFFDYYHDNNKRVLEEMNIDKRNMYPMDIKYLVNSSQTYSKDYVTYHLQMKPSQECVVPYYKDLFKDMYGAHYPCGLYCLIPDSKGVLNRWLVVAEANYNDPQFPTFELLRCDKVIQYVHDGKMYNVPAVLRSQNSYNSGIWADQIVTSSQDQQKFIVPLNRDTENIFYNKRIIIDNMVYSEPRAFIVSKVNRIANCGLAMITLSQEEFDKHKDAYEFSVWNETTREYESQFYHLGDEFPDGKLIGLWADYFDSSIKPIEFEPEEPKTTIHFTMDYAGIKPEIKPGGSYKKMFVDFFDANEKSILLQSGKWSFTVTGANTVTDLLQIVMSDNTVATCDIPFTTSSSVKDNEIKIKFNRCKIGNEKTKDKYEYDSYIGHILNVTYTPDDSTIKPITTEIEITSL